MSPRRNNLQNREIMRILIIFIAFSVLLPAMSIRAESGEDFVKVDLVSSTGAVQGGVPFEVAVRFRIEPQWHLYWINPGDSGLPPRVQWKLPEGFTASELQFPIPKSFDAAGIKNIGYSNELVLLATITPPQQVSDEVKLSADVTWLVCKEICLPGKAEVALTLKAAAEKAAVLERDFSQFRSHLPQPGEVRVKTDVKQDAGSIESITLSCDLQLPPGAKEVEFFPGPSEKLVAGDAKINAEKGELEFTATPLNKSSQIDETLMGVVAYTDSTGNRKGIEVRIPIRADARK